MDRKYSQNLARLYIVHPTFWLKLVNGFFKALASADFFEKVEYLDRFDLLLCVDVEVKSKQFGGVV